MCLSFLFTFVLWCFFVLFFSFQSLRYVFKYRVVDDDQRFKYETFYEEVAWLACDNDDKVALVSNCVMCIRLTRWPLTLHKEEPLNKQYLNADTERERHR